MGEGGRKGGEFTYLAQHHQRCGWPLRARRPTACQRRHPGDRLERRTLWEDNEGRKELEKEERKWGKIGFTGLNEQN